MSTHGLSAPFLTGLLEAEGSFGVRMNNGGASWACWMTVNLRDDDTQLLVELHQLSGLGHLRAVPARATSKPQVQWRISKHGDCLRLAEMLRAAPMLGRKRREAEVWSQAVRALSASSRPDSLPLLVRQLDLARRYVDATERAPDAVVIPRHELVPYFGGFFTGDGHLYLSRKQARVCVRLRDDDRPLLEAFAASTGLGSIYPSRAYGSSRPSAAWVIHRRDQLPAAVDLLERAGLRGRKRREFEIWREAALEFARPRVERNHGVIEAALTRLGDARAYRPPAEPLAAPDAVRERRRAHIAALKEAAREADGVLTATAYEAQRALHGDWPNRNTITIAFGSWAAALGAAGLEHRCSSRARSDAAQGPREYTDEQLAQRRARRELVLRAVKELAVPNDAERMPTVHEFLAYRAAHDPSLPSLMSLYNLFPGGWWSVLRQAGFPARPPQRRRPPNPAAPARV